MEIERLLSTHRIDEPLHLYHSPLPLLDLKVGSCDRPEQPQPGVRITEVDEEGEAVAEDESNVHMQAAEMQLMAPREVEEDFNRMLSKLVSSPVLAENLVCKAMKNVW